MNIFLRYIGLVGLLTGIITESNAADTKKLECFPVNNVELLDSRFKHAQDLDRAYLMGLDPDRLLAPYRKGTGLVPKAENYPNWENTGLDGHIGGHYLSALAYMYAATGNEEIGRRLDYVLGELKLCQDNTPDGYLCGVPDGRRIWNEIAAGNIRASEFNLNGGWVPLYNIHKIYAGLRDAYLLAGRNDAREMLIKLTDWMINLTYGLSDEQIQDMLRSEHGGLNEVFADVAAITGNRKYLELAHRFSHNKILAPLIEGKDELTGKHANTQIPKVIGYKRIADIDHSERWEEAASYFWDNVVDKRTVVFGGNSVEEHFHATDNFSKMLRSEQGPETCNTYNMLRLTKMLYESDPDPKYTDYYERALYNHILTSINPVQGGFVYFTPVRSGHYRVYSQPQTSFWCCVGSGLENHARYGEMIYAHDDSDVYVNLFIPSRLKSDLMSLTQINNFPESEQTVLVIDSIGNSHTRLHLRVPGWLSDTPRLTVNGRDGRFKTDNGYLVLDEHLKAGDTITYVLPMELRAEQLPDQSPNYAFVYGPIVLSLKSSDENLTGHFADESRGGHIANGQLLPLDKAPVIVDDKCDPLSHLSKIEGKNLQFSISGVSPAAYENAVLEPFYNMTDHRYILYWPVLSPTELQERNTELTRQEQERISIDTRTIDKVICGEQQPESDHAIFAERSTIGSDYDRHWRETGSKFGYVLRNNSKGRQLRIHYRPESRRSAKVTVNGHEIGTLDKLSGSTENYQTLDLPENCNGETLQLTITPEGSRNTPHIYEIRLLTD